MPTAVAFTLAGVCLSAQRSPPTRDASDDRSSARLAILVAEDRRAATPRELAIVRAGLGSQDGETSRVAVRAIGRLERPDLIPDLIAMLESPLREIRAEAANAIGQAAQGWKEIAARPALAAHPTRNAPAPEILGLDTAAAELIARLKVDGDAGVRAVLCQTIGRLPYTTAEQVQRAEAALLEALTHDDGVEGRLGVAQGLEALIRLHGKMSPPSAAALARLRELATRNAAGSVTPDARVRRLALEALVGVDAADEATIVRAGGDPDAQVRRLAMRAARAVSTPSPPHTPPPTLATLSAVLTMTGAAPDAAGDVVQKGLADPSPIVRIEALRARRGTPSGCAAAIAAVRDDDPAVTLVALDQLAPCAASPDGTAAASVLEAAVNDLSQAGSPRGWHRGAHAMVALAAAAPDRARRSLSQFAGSSRWPLRMYAARAATLMKDRATLEKLAADADDNVCEAAIEGLSRAAGHAADATYVQALDRRGYQVLRAAARALTAASPTPDTAVKPLKAALRRLTEEGRDTSRDARAAVSDALRALGEHVPPLKPVRETPVTSGLSAGDLRRLAAARARVTIRGVGTFELALFITQAPASVVRFARLAESGYYDGLTFHRVVPNFVIQGGSPGANEYVGDAAFMRDEVGLWPHVRGAVGISTRGRDTGDAQIFIDLVDNPRLDHDYTVFAQVLNGMEVVDHVLEGDVIERIAIVLGS